MRRITAVRFALGATAVLQPRRAAALWGADPRSDKVVVVARVLGGRHLAQATLLAVHPTSASRTVGMAVDLLHGLTMVVLAAVSPRLRRPAATSACVALAMVAATEWDRRRDA